MQGLRFALGVQESGETKLTMKSFQSLLDFCPMANGKNSFSANALLPRYHFSNYSQRAEIINPVILFQWEYSKLHFLSSTEVK